MFMHSFLCPNCKKMIKIDRRESPDFCYRWLVIFTLKDDDFDQADNLLRERFGTAYLKIIKGVAIINQGPHACFISGQIKLCLGKNLHHLLVFHIDQDACLQFPLSEYGLQTDIERHLELPNTNLLENF